MRDIDGLLYLIRAEPSLCPLVPATGADLGDAALMENRGRTEIHMCLACGGQADAAMIAVTPDGKKRWLDICWDDYVALAAPDLEGPWR